MSTTETTSCLETEIAGIKMKNPIMPASGCFGFGRDYAKFYDLSVLGGIAIKAVSVEPRSGNDTPRVAETPSGMLNSIGLQNPGLDKIIESELKFLEDFDTRIFVNVVGNTVEDYCTVVERISRVGNVDAIELNVSCPNVKNGIHFGTNENELEALTREVKRVSAIPVFIKLSPNVTNIVAMAKAAERGGADGLSLINTLLGMRIDLKTRKPILARGSGGLSGPAIKPVAIRMVYETSNEVKLPIIGMGGVTCVDDVIEFAIAGATAIGVGTANFIEPMICPEIIKALPARMQELGIKSLRDLRK
ncbi:MAG: dihydroorotate dehydrogenase [Cyanobacteria bacterium]|nr:dihydroorotate dehydrogenase [Cyanobacteriota bacterium]MDA1020825.1 dihydroorotate dehydrogenase [Cyanobacteriota bacterium]